MTGPSIYTIRCLANDKIYVGATSRCAKNRISNHKFRLRRGSHSNTLLQEDWNRLGEAKFEFLIQASVDIEKLVDAESRLIVELGDRAYNEVLPARSVVSLAERKRFIARRPKGEAKMVFKRTVTKEVYEKLEELLSMDTTKFDQKMEELRMAAKNGQLTKPEVDKVLKEGLAKPSEKGDSKPKEAFVLADEGKDSPKEINELKAALEERGCQIRALLEDIESKDQIVKNQEEKIQKIARLTDNEKLILWIRKYDQLEAAFKELQFRMQGLEA